MPKKTGYAGALKGTPKSAGTSQKGYPAGKKSGKLGKVKMSTKKGFNQKRMSQAVNKVFGLSSKEDQGKV